jgi:hypothetical protein
MTDDLDPPPLTDPRLLALYGYWLGKCAGRRLPARADLRPEEMRPWLGNLMLIDVSPDGSYQYRLYGTRFVEQFGVEMTGKTIDILAPGQAAAIRSEYDIVRETRAPRSRRYTASFDVFLHGPIDKIELVRTWERLVLPLSRSEPETVAMLLIGAYQQGQTAT